MTIQTMTPAVSPTVQPFYSTAALELDMTRDSGMQLARSMPCLPGEVVVLEAACGRVLAEPVCNRSPLPRYDVAMLDGYAVRRGDLIGEGPWTCVVGPTTQPTPCEAVEVASGARIPASFDAVIPKADGMADDRRLIVTACPPRNAHVQPRGQDARTGTTLLEAGHVLTARDIALLAGLGRSEVAVNGRMYVAGLSIGSDLIETGTKLGRGQTHDGNRPMLASSIRVPWITYLDNGVAGSTPGAVASALSLAASMADVVIVTGGASSGPDAPLRMALEHNDGRVVSETLTSAPGISVTIATVKGSMVIGLPGHPVRAAIAMELLGWDIVRKRAGIARPRIAGCQGIAAFTMDRPEAGTAFPLVTVESHAEDGTPVLHLTSGGRNASLRTLARADGFARIVPGDKPVGNGMRVAWSRFCTA